MNVSDWLPKFLKEPSPLERFFSHLLAEGEEVMADWEELGTRCVSMYRQDFGRE